MVLDAIANPDKYVIIGTAPSVRVAVGEEFGYPIGSDVEGKMVSNALIVIAYQIGVIVV